MQRPARCCHRQLPVRCRPRIQPASRGLPIFLRYCRRAYRGKQYCLPDFVSTVVVAYRKDLLKRPGSSRQNARRRARRRQGAGTAGGDRRHHRFPARRRARPPMCSRSSPPMEAGGTTRPQAGARHGSGATKAIQFYVDAAKYAPAGHTELPLRRSRDRGGPRSGGDRPFRARRRSLGSRTPSVRRPWDKWAYVPLAADAGSLRASSSIGTGASTPILKDPQAAYSFIQYWTSAAQQAAVARTAKTAGATKDFYEDKALVADLPFLPALQAGVDELERPAEPGQLAAHPGWRRAMPCRKPSRARPAPPTPRNRSKIRCATC